MLRKPVMIGLIAALVCLGAAGIYFSGILQPAQPACAQNSSCRQEACVGDCVAYQYFLSKSLEPWVRWYDTAWTLTGCDEPAWREYAGWLLDLAAEFVEAPGGNTMSCHQMVVGQAYVCGNQCNSNACRYAPNVDLTLSACGEGLVSATVDNNAHLGSLPEYEPSAYSRNFNLKLTVSRDGGAKVVVGSQAVPSLSYSNWIINGGYTRCVSEYGTGRPCDLIEPFLKPSSASFDFDWGDALYSMEGMTTGASGMDSAPSSGAIALKSDGDKVTVKQSNLRGVAYVWDHDLENDTVSENVTAWDASTGNVSFSNHECNCTVCWCNVVGTRRDVDTYVVATGGDTSRRLLGEYSLEVDAGVAHDKDLSDNTAICSFTASDQPPPPPPDSATATPEPLQVIALGPGTYHISPDASQPNRMYSLQVPPGLAYFSVSMLESGNPPGNYNLYMRRGSPPALFLPDYCSSCGDCVSENPGGYTESCWTSRPAAGTYYLLVQHEYGGGPYDLTIAYTTPTPTATRTATATATAIPTATMTATVTGGLAATSTPSGGAQPSATPTPTAVVLSGSYNESEPNNTLPQADAWTGIGTMAGQLAAALDRDYYRWSAPASGIYTLTLDQVPAAIAADLVILDSGANIAISDYSQPTGAPVSLRWDANSGETFTFLVKASTNSQKSDQPYRLTLSYLPDPAEPDDSLSTARLWIDLHTPLQGYFWERISGSSDSYLFTAPESALITLEVSNVAGGVQPDLVIYNHDRSIITSDYSAPAGGSTKLTFDANAGETFFVRVAPSLTSQTSDQSYTLSASLVPDPYEPDDTRPNARVWDYAGGPAAGYFWEDGSGTGDYYKITVPGAAAQVTLTVRLEDVTGPVQPDLVVYNAAGTIVKADYTAGAGQAVQLTFNAAGGKSYYILVRPSQYTQVSGAPYRLSVAPP